jgi:hypothetical protein
MGEYDEELTVILLAVLQFESNVHTIAGIAAQAAVMHELGVTRRDGGDYSYALWIRLRTVCKYYGRVIPQYSRDEQGSLHRNSRTYAVRWHPSSTGMRDQQDCRE